MRKINVLYLFVVGLFFVTSSCKKDDVFVPEDIQESKGFYIVNEGLFGQGNASLSFYDYDSNTVLNNLFEGINQRPLGDVFQSLTFYKGKGYIVVNNSRKIEVVDSASMKSIETVSDFSSPRKIHFYKDKAYVTDLYSNKIYILDANTLAQRGSIEVDGSTEDIVELNGDILVTVNQSFEYSEDKLQGLLVIDPNADTLKQYVKLSEGAVDIEVDKVGNVWVHCTGHWNDPDATGKLYQISGEDYKVLQIFDYGRLAYFSSPLKVNQTGDVLFIALPGDPSSYTEYNIHKMSIYATSLPTEVYYSGSGRYLYGYNFDEFKKELIVLDALEGGQKGELVRVDAETKAELGTYEVGYFPSSIVFKY
ncbi:MAG TPA: DUF5074 domain-containing protein [Chitinophagales bacterium]|nr:DUF5074 domain-containing protein [Chitinophagales bacterium]